MTVAVLTKVGEVSGSSRHDFTDECAKVSDERVISVDTAGFSTSIVKLNATISANKPVEQRAIQKKYLLKNTYLYIYFYIYIFFAFCLLVS